MKDVFILIGVPGAGKSHAAKKIVEQATADAKTFAVHSTDQFFIINGEYHFDWRQLAVNHLKNHVEFLKSIIRGVQRIVVDNTNLFREHRHMFASIAREAGYRINYIMVGKLEPDNLELHAKYAARNLHGVPVEKITKMSSGFEKIIDSELVSGDTVQDWE